MDRWDAFIDENAGRKNQGWRPGMIRQDGGRRVRNAKGGRGRHFKEEEMVYRLNVAETHFQ